jgi:hypothetical protein
MAGKMRDSGRGADTIKNPLPHAPCDPPAGSTCARIEWHHVFRRHDDAHALAPTRDLIEIVAILAAGIWAIYVFAYEQRIKPAAQPPSVLISGSLHKLGERNGLVQLGYKGTLRNMGSTNVSLIALGFTANGFRYATQGTPRLSTLAPGSTLYQRDARIGARALVYRATELESFVDRRYGGDITLSPGEEIPFSGIFLVKREEFDSITFYGSAAFTKIAKEGAYPTTIGYTRDGAVTFDSPNHDPNFHALEVTLDQLTLW